ncbi:MAG TPA: hydroxyacid dehydrogenase [Candidatus Parcubacteria bacterium]|nr:hydroxyacid dehydrogenase [Candidatus Parcubacteria bacterium]
MKKKLVAFFETEPWEEDYLRQNLNKRLSGRLSLKFFKSPLKKTNIKEIKSAEVLAVFIYSKLDEKIISELPRLKFITTMSTGFDHIDIESCQKRKIKVSNVPYYGENTVAEHTFALILSLSRKIPQSIERTQRGDFTLKGLRGFDLKGKTIGIIGLGHIGKQVAKIANGFEMKIKVYDVRKDLEAIKNFGVKYTSLKNLLNASDIITLHAPYNQATHHLINKENVKEIKKGAYLINTARGGLVETGAIILALKNNILGGVGLDVLEEECFIKEEKSLLTKPFQKTCDLRTVLQGHFLLRHPRVVVTPHNAFNSQEALVRILDTTVENITGFIRNKPLNLIKNGKR